MQRLVNCPVLVARDLSGFRSVRKPKTGRRRVRVEVLQGVRQMRFEGLLGRHERGQLSRDETAEMLGSWSGRSGVGAIGCADQVGQRAKAR
jgi:hypothetical protein